MDLGVGELLLTDISRDGVYKGLSREIDDIINENKYNFFNFAKWCFKSMDEMMYFDKRFLGW